MAMSMLEQDLDDIFGADGPLMRALPGFRVRREQLHMARRVARALEARESLVVEAGTGTGKTFAYLVPALLSGLRVLISTGTRTLQDQLYAKDLPLLAGALGRPARVALLKGRTNYLCRYRLEQAGAAQAQDALPLGARPRARGAGAMLERIRRWSLTTRRGDLAEVRGLADTSPVWAQLTSTRDTCLGARCPELARCHVVQARRDALDADVVIVNHHLLLADLALKEDGFGDLLGASDAVILDEAHQIPDLATQFFGVSVGTRQLDALLQDTRTALTAGATSAAAGGGRGAPQSGCAAALRAAEAALDALRRAAAVVTGARPLEETAVAGSGTLEALGHALGELSEALAPEEPQGPLAGLAERAADLAARLARITEDDGSEGARTLEASPRALTVSLMPFDISERFSTLLTARRAAWIFTSATLSVGEAFGHFTSRLGLGAAETLRIASPFDFERQALLYLPTGLPEPSAPGHVNAVIEEALPLIDAARGGAFLLFTSHRALTLGARQLRERWGGTEPYRLLVQGEAPRERLLEEFRADGNAVLLGTSSFWEGVDVKGQALRLVIIDKLPFASPDDPLVRARIEHLTASGANSFSEYQLPEAALALKQGVGRLIRSEDDYGVVVICDPRLRGRGYGRIFIAALPPMRIAADEAEVRGFLARHAPRAAGGARAAAAT